MYFVVVPGTVGTVGSQAVTIAAGNELLLHVTVFDKACDKYKSGCVCILDKILSKIHNHLHALCLFFCYVCVIDGRFKHYLFCFSALVLLVKGPSVQLTQPGLSLCPLFTVTVIRPMEAQTKGGLFLLSCPGLSAPLWAHTEPRGWGVVGGAPGGFDLANLTARVREQKRRQ